MNVRLHALSLCHIQVTDHNFLDRECEILQTLPQALISDCQPLAKIAFYSLHTRHSMAAHPRIIFIVPGTAETQLLGSWTHSERLLLQVHSVAEGPKRSVPVDAAPTGYVENLYPAQVPPGFQPPCMEYSFAALLQDCSDAHRFSVVQP